MQEIIQVQDDTITRLMAILEEEQDSVEDKEQGSIQHLIKHLENTKLGYHQSLQGVGYYYFAFACLIARAGDIPINSTDVDVTDVDELLELTSKVKDLSVMQMVEEIRKIAEDLEQELQKHFPKLFENLEAEQIQDFRFEKSMILAMDIDEDSDEASGEEDSNAFLLWQIHKHYLQKLNALIANPKIPNDFTSEYLALITEHYQAVGYEQEELQQISIYAFYKKSETFTKNRQRELELANAKVKHKEGLY